jgi:hypothetical protein
VEKEPRLTVSDGASDEERERETRAQKKQTNKE